MSAKQESIAFMGQKKRPFFRRLTVEKHPIRERQWAATSVLNPRQTLSVLVSRNISVGQHTYVLFWQGRYFAGGAIKGCSKEASGSSGTLGKKVALRRVSNTV